MMTTRLALLLVLSSLPRPTRAFSSCRHHHATLVRLTSSANDDNSEKISESWNTQGGSEFTSSYRPPIIPFDITTVADAYAEIQSSPPEITVELPQVIPFCDDSFELDDHICEYHTLHYLPLVY